MTVIIFLVVLVMLILSHELGHFLAAKTARIKVEEFGIGFPPRLWGWKYGETLYSLNLLPLGGFVKIYGETDSEQLLTAPDRQRALCTQPKLIQAWVIVAGVIFNLLLAWLLLTFGFITGLPSSTSVFPAGQTAANAKLLIVGVLPESPAEQAGLRPGDEIVYLETPISRIELASEPRPERVQNFIAKRGGQEITIGYRRGDVFAAGSQATEGKIAVVPKKEGNKGVIGITMDTVALLHLSWSEAGFYAAKLTLTLTVATIKGVVEFISRAVRGEAVLQAVIGPVGLAGLVGDVSRLGLVYLLSFIAFISINLAVINLIPVPALDGGRLLFLGIESLKGSPLKPKLASSLNFVGLALLLLLMAVVTYGDIKKLF